MTLTVLLAGWLALSPAVAGETVALGALFGELRELCTRPPAAACTTRVHTWLDRDGDGGIAPGEFEAMRLQARAELQKPDDRVSDTERGMLALALLAFESAGSSTVFEGFDGDGDGRILADEMFADFRLDERPFDAVVADPKAVDWQSFANRFGKTGRMFLPLLQTAGGQR